MAVKASSGQPKFNYEQLHHISSLTMKRQLEEAGFEGPEGHPKRHHTELAQLFSKCILFNHGKTADD
jgi:hypothetical protein